MKRTPANPVIILDQIGLNGSLRVSNRHEELLLIAVDPITFDSIKGCINSISIEYAPLKI
jgi:hypothetical protein